MVAEVTPLFSARSDRCPHTYLQIGLDDSLSCALCGEEVEVDDPTAPCPECGFYRDNPAHEYGCEAGRKENS